MNVRWRMADGGCERRTGAPVIDRCAPDSDIRHCLGFTLIEMVVVIAIIALLMGLLTPAVIKARHNGQRAATEQLMGSLMTACQTFERDLGFLPPSRFDSLDVRKIVAHPEVAAGSSDSVKSNEWNGGELLFQALVGPLDEDEDAREGPGFRTSLTSRVYGPYIDPKKTNVAARFDLNGDLTAGEGEWWQIIPTNNVREDPEAYVFVDNWANPICYYRANTLDARADNQLAWGTPNLPTTSVRFDENDNDELDHDPATGSGDPALDSIDRSRLLSAELVLYSRGRNKLNSTSDERADDLVVAGP